MKPVIVKNPLNKLQQVDLAALFGVTDRTVRNWDFEGLPGNGEGRGRYYVWPEVLAWYLARNSGSGTGEDPTARERKDMAEAELAELKLGQLRGTLLQVEDVRATWSEVLGRVRAKLLSIPPKAAVRLGDGLTAAQRQEVIQQEVDEALAELSSQGGGL